MAVLGADKESISLGADSRCLGGGPLCFVKNGEGGMKYQEGCHTRTTSRVEGCMLLLECTYQGNMEHKPGE